MVDEFSFYDDGANHLNTIEWGVFLIKLFFINAKFLQITKFNKVIHLFESKNIFELFSIN